MENQKKKIDLKQMKIQIAIHMGYFNHRNHILNILATFIINVFAGVVLVGFTNSLMPLLVGNYIHMIIFFAAFTIGELFIKYLMYAINFGAVVRTKGFFLLPYQILVFYTLVVFFDIQFTSFISLILFTLLFSSAKSAVRFVYRRIQNYFVKGERKPWNKL